MKLGAVESKFADIVWENQPISTKDLVQKCEKELNWKRTTTYTVLKRLSERGLFRNEGGTVTTLVSRDSFYGKQSRRFVEEYSRPVYTPLVFHDPAVLDTIGYRVLAVLWVSIALLAALILGKENNMRELDISLNLLRNSRLPERSRYLESGELVTVVGNLLENAMEAVNSAPAGGMRSVTLQITEDENGLLLMVSDTGDGIREEDLPHIFEHGFSTKARSGRGLGMKLIADIVERQGGSIDVDTEPGSGTTISVIFSRERGDLS